MAGCGGGGSGSSDSSSTSGPTQSQLYQPFLGTWTLVWTNTTTNATGTTAIAMTSDQAEVGFNDNSTGQVIGTLFNSLQMPPVINQSFITWAVAYPDFMTYNASRTVITRLDFIFTTEQDAPELTNELGGPASGGPYVQMVPNTTASSTTLTGTFTDTPAAAGEQDYNVTLTKQ